MTPKDVDNRQKLLYQGFAYVVTCKRCKYYRQYIDRKQEEEFGCCSILYNRNGNSHITVYPTDFCSFGEKK